MFLVTVREDRNSRGESVVSVFKYVIARKGAPCVDLKFTSRFRTKGNQTLARLAGV
jgi:hypothetical protein